MRRYSQFICFSILLSSCVEPYKFIVEDKEPRLVIEGYITDKSYNETRLYPSDGRYFTVKLSFTSNVTNERGETIQGATVQLVDNLGEQKDYIELGNGTYSILDPNFKAESNHEYKLKVSFAGDSYESSWESIPSQAEDPMGEIGFDEIDKQAYKVQSGVKVVKTISGVNTFIQLPEKDGSQPTYYKWDFTPHWIFIATLPSFLSPVKTCWVNEPYYLSSYTLQEDNNGGYKKNLFFLETFENERIFEDLSVLIRQQVLSKDYYNFLKELQEQDEGALLSDKPPYNLQTNFSGTNGQLVVGYFGIVREQAKRWYFNRFDLSYVVQNNLSNSCIPTAPGPFIPAEGCVSCLDYQNGEPSNIKPIWWH